MIATEEDIDNCQFAVWYPLLQKNSIKSIIIPLNHEFIEYLKQDGIIVPKSVADVLDNNESDDENEAKSECSSSDEIKVNSFPEIEEAIKKAIDELDGDVFVKTNWSAPIDASWINCETMKCKNIHEVFLLLKASDRIMFDVEKMYELCPNTTKSTPTNYTLIMRKWANLQPSMEFRIFVKDSVLVGICQRDGCTVYPFLKSSISDIQARIVKFFDDVLQEKMHIPSYSLDLYIDKKNRVWVIDVNPYGSPTCPLLFEWEELNALDHLEVRIVNTEEEKLSSAKGMTRGPIDVHLAEDFSKFMEICRAQNNEPE